MAVHVTADLSNERRRIDDLAPRHVKILRIVGAVGLFAAILLAGVTQGVENFFRAYVTAFAFVISLPLGALFFVMFNLVTRAGWSVGVRRVAELMAATIPWLALLFIPLLIPLLTDWVVLWPWADAETVAADPLTQKKTAYLNVPFFLVRMVIYFGIWSWLGRYFLAKSTEQDRNGDVAITLEMERVAAVGLFLFALSTTFFGFDLLMSLEPHWFSTIFGVYYFAGSVIGFFAFITLLMLWLQHHGRLTQTVTVEHYHDFGKFLFGFVVFWAYIGFSQYMLIWYANIPEETQWFLARQQGPWLGITLLLLFGHFIIPFLGLISRIPKRSRVGLAIGAGWMLVMHWLDEIWLAKPTIGHAADDHGHAIPFPIGIVDVALLVGLFGLFLSILIDKMGQHSLICERDPRLPEALTFENV